MGDKTSMDTKWKYIGGAILAILLFAIWYFKEHHDIEDRHHDQEQQEQPKNKKEEKFGGR